MLKWSLAQFHTLKPLLTIFTCNNGYFVTNKQPPENLVLCVTKILGKYINIATYGIIVTYIKIKFLINPHNNTSK